MTVRKSVKSKLKHRCPCCKKLRGFREPPGDQGGEDHRRPPWELTPFGWACGYCAMRYSNQKNVKMSPEEIFGNIWDILVKHCGAYAADKERFVYSMMENKYPIREYRFCGMFGMAGKFWRNDDRYYVSGYNFTEISPDKYATQENLINNVNELLSKFPYWDPS